MNLRKQQLRPSQRWTMVVVLSSKTSSTHSQTRAYGTTFRRNGISIWISVFSSGLVRSREYSLGAEFWQVLDDVLDVMRQNPEPQIQSLCLQHLPVELIQQIYQMSTQKDARTLSSTSRYMRAMALPYIFGVSGLWNTPHTSDIYL